MAGTRRSTRVANSSSTPIYNEDILEGKIPRSASGKKRKPQAGSSPAAKRGKTASDDKQQTLEESLDDSKPAPPVKSDDAQDAELAEVIEKSKTEVAGPSGDQKSADTEMVDAPEAVEPAPAPAPAPTPVSAQVDAKPAEEAGDAKAVAEPSSTTARSEVVSIENKEPAAKVDELSEAPVEVNGGKDQPSVENGAPEKVEETPKKVEEAPKQVQEAQHVSQAGADGLASSESKEVPIANANANANANGETAVERRAPDHDTPSSILEKGILYFLFRGRVGIEDPQNVNDIARSFLVMRPLPHDAKLGEGPIGDAENCRLIAVPKKVLPGSGKDRFLSFLEKAKASFSDLKDSFSASDYETKTLGTRHTPAMTPIGEAVYAITTTGRESHLAYILTIPAQIGEVQKDIGLKERGSFIISTKNPKAPSPANANIGRSPEYPQDILDEFRSLRWMPTQPKHLDYVSTQVLLIGESSGIEKATEPQPEDEKKGADTPLEEMEKLEGEDEIRVRHLKGDDSIFSDLELSKRDFPKVPSTW